MSLFDKIMDKNMKRAKKMQEKMLDMQEEVYGERGEQIERMNRKSAEIEASGTKIRYAAATSGIKEGLNGKSTKFCHECGKEIDATAKYCSECGMKQD